MLITKAIEKALTKTPLYSTDGKADDERDILVKFFNPCGRSTWYVLEAEKQESGDWTFFGYVEGEQGPDCDEFGYFTLSDLTQVKLPFGLRIERDRHFSGKLIEVR